MICTIQLHGVANGYQEVAAVAAPFNGFFTFSDLIAQQWQEQDYRSTQIGFDILSFIP